MASIKVNLVEKAGKTRAYNTRDIVVTVAVGLAIVGLVYLVNQPGSIVGQTRPVVISQQALGPPPEVGKPAPDFEVQGLNGEVVRLSDFKGKAVWLNFWATWCPPCRAEIPDMIALYNQRKGEGIEIIGLSIGEQKDTVRDYAERVGMNYSIGLDSNTAISAKYRIAGIPSHFFIDKEGVIRNIRVGAMTRKMMDETISQLLVASTRR